jgi:predicted solute-binding protein
MINDIDNMFKKLQGLDFEKDLKKKYDESTPEEQKEHDEIKKQLAQYLRNKDFEGARKYLQHIKKK